MRNSGRGRWVIYRAAELARRMFTRGGQFVLCFHGVASRRYPGLCQAAQPFHTVDDLQFTLKWIGERFAFLTPEAFFTGAPGVLLTFDDGFANQAANVIPVLEMFQAPAIFFVPGQHVCDPKNWLEFVLELAGKCEAGKELPAAFQEDCLDGMGEAGLRTCASHPLVTIGGHTMTHPWLTRCSLGEVRREIGESKAYLEKVTGHPVHYFAYPAGKYTREIARAVEEAGYQAAFALDAHGLADRQYEIPRVGLYASDEVYLALKLSGLHRRPVRMVN